MGEIAHVCKNKTIEMVPTEPLKISHYIISLYNALLQTNIQGIYDGRE